MKKLLILVLFGALAGCAEEMPQPPDPSEGPPSEFSEKALEDERETQRETALMIVEEAVEGYRLFDSEKRYPNNLNQLIDGGLLPSLPELPSGYRFQYNPSDGKVEVVSIDSKEGETSGSGGSD